MSPTGTPGTTALRHRTVLLDEAVDALVWRPDGAYVDGTFGRGGHSRAILARLGLAGTLVAFDKDPAAIAEAGTIGDARFSVTRELWRHGRAAVRPWSAGGRAARPGNQLAPDRRGGEGFSFRFEGPLDMRMDTTRGMTAAEWLAQADEQDIARVIRDYGEERFAVQIAKAIVARRSEPGDGGALATTQTLPRSWRKPSKHARRVRTLRPAPFKLYGFTSIKSLRTSRAGLKAAYDLLQVGGASW